jgi:hypothetical protein
MSIEYNHRTYDLDGNWDPATGELKMWFPHRPSSEVLWQSRKERLLRGMGAHTIAPSVQLIKAEDLSTTATDEIIVTEEFVPAEMTDRELVIVDALYLSESPEELIRRISPGAIAALRCPMPNPEDILQTVGQRILYASAHTIENIYAGSMFRRDKTKK